MTRQKRTLTPPPRCSGIFSLIPPFEPPTSVVFTVDAIESFRELKADGIDVYKRYYQKHGLAQTDYTEDDKLGACIITLRAGDGTLIEVPDTYIASYPGDSGIDHKRMVLVCDLGLIPDYLNIDFVSADVADVVKKSTGVVSKVDIAIAPVRTQLTYEQHIASERQRKQNIAMYESKDEQLAKALTENTYLRKQVEELEKIIIQLNETKK